MVLTSVEGLFGGFLMVSGTIGIHSHCLRPEVLNYSFFFVGFGLKLKAARSSFIITTSHRRLDIQWRSVFGLSLNKPQRKEKWTAGMGPASKEQNGGGPLLPASLSPPEECLSTGLNVKTGC